MATGSNNQVRYRIGQQPVITARCTNAAGALANPTTITFQTVDPAGTQTSTSNPNAAITNPSTGIWVYTWPGSTGVTVAGMYGWRVKGVGTVIDADDGTFEVLATTVPTP